MASSTSTGTGSASAPPTAAPTEAGDVTTFDFALADSTELFHRTSVILTIFLVLLGLVAVAALAYIGLRSSRAAKKLKAKLERQMSKRRPSKTSSKGYSQLRRDDEDAGSLDESTHNSNNTNSIPLDAQQAPGQPDRQAEHIESTSYALMTD